MWLRKRNRLLLSSWLFSCTSAHYLPGVSPISFEEGDEVKLKVNKLTSTKNLPVDYYRLPFCSPEGGPEVFKENLGELLMGDRIESSPYRLNMKQDMYCEQLCISHLGKKSAEGKSPNKATRAIQYGYHVNWIVDNLSAATKTSDDIAVRTNYFEGFPVGYIGDDNEAYIHNHVNIEIMYHPVEMMTGQYRIVRFTVEPFSIKHNFEPVDDDDDDEVDSESQSFTVATIDNPIDSCKENVEIKQHTSHDMIKNSYHEPQPASGKALFTYDVIWIQNDSLNWASRWDIYLTMDSSIPARVHWFNITNGFVVVLILSILIITVLVQNLKKDLMRYNMIATDEEQLDGLEESGWKLVHADVFRPPSNPLLLSVCCGSGVQILLMTLLSIIFAAIGFLSPARRGSLVIAQLIFYVCMGIVAGYVSAKTYKTFKGASWQKNTIMTALLFPGILFTVFFLLNIMAWFEGSTDAVPFSTLIVLIVMWFGISTPLVFLGSYVGYKAEPIEFPVSTSSMPRQIPDQEWYMGLKTGMILTGVLPFGVVFVEIYFIMASVWADQYYYVFGILMIVFMMLLLTCAEVAVIYNYIQLCSEDYRWWWRSFFISGSVSLYIFLYSFIYFKDLHATSFGTGVLYFGCMAVASLGIFLMTGTVGMFCSLWFNMAIFGSIKVD